MHRECGKYLSASTIPLIRLSKWSVDWLVAFFDCQHYGTSIMDTADPTLARPSSCGLSLEDLYIVATKPRHWDKQESANNVGVRGINGRRNSPLLSFSAH